MSAGVPHLFLGEVVTTGGIIASLLARPTFQVNFLRDSNGNSLFQLDFVDFLGVCCVFGLFLFLFYAVRTNPLPMIRPLSFLICFFPFCLGLLCFWVVGWYGFGLWSYSLALASASGGVCWVIWAAVATMNFLEEKNWKGVRSRPLLGCIPDFRNALQNSRKMGYLYSVAEEKGLSVYMRLGDMRGQWCADPEDVEYILKTNHQNFVKGPIIKDVFYDLLGDGIFNADGHLWFDQRKGASKEFSVGRFRDYMLKIFGNYALGVTNHLNEAAKTGEKIDLQDMFFRYTLDSFSDLAFGLKVGCVNSEDQQPPFASAFDRANVLIARRFSDPFWKISRALKRGSEGELADSLSIINNFVFDVVRKRKEMGKEELEKHEDFLSRFLRLADPNTGERPSDKYLRDMVLNFVIAGRDTTASGLSWTLFELSQHPEIIERAREEIFSVMGEPEGNEVRKPNYEELKKMHYLHAVFSEALRIHPPVPFDGKFALADDVLPSGLKIRGGDATAFVPYTMGRSPLLWDDPLEMKPERWLKDGVFQRASPFKFSVFQAGPRQCLGVDFAYLEAKLMLAVFLQTYDFKLAMDPNDVKESQGLTMSIQTGLPVFVSRRQ